MLLRVLILVAAVAGPSVATAQSSFVDAAVGTNGRAEVLRATLGVNRGALTPTLQVTVTSDRTTVGGRSQEEVGMRLGLGLSRRVPVGDRVSLGAGGGLALAFDRRYDAGRDPATPGDARMQSGLLLPLDATALVRVHRGVDVSVTGTRNVALLTVDSRDRPASAVSLPQLGGWEVTAGLRFWM